MREVKSRCRRSSGLGQPQQAGVGCSPRMGSREPHENHWHVCSRRGERRCHPGRQPAAKGCCVWLLPETRQYPTESRRGKQRLLPRQSPRTGALCQLRERPDRAPYGRARGGVAGALWPHGTTSIPTLPRPLGASASTGSARPQDRFQPTLANLDSGTRGRGGQARGVSSLTQHARSRPTRHVRSYARRHRVGSAQLAGHGMQERRRWSKYHSQHGQQDGRALASHGARASQLAPTVVAGQLCSAASR